MHVRFLQSGHTHVPAGQRARDEVTARRDEAFDLAGQLSTQGYMNRIYGVPPAALRGRR